MLIDLDGVCVMIPKLFTRSNVYFPYRNALHQRGISSAAFMGGFFCTHGIALEARTIRSSVAFIVRCWRL